MEAQRVTLDYTGPKTPRRRSWLTSGFVALCIVWIAILGFVLVPPYVGSGVMRPNPFSLLSAGAVWILTLIYVWLRLREDTKWPCFGLRLLGIGASLSVIAMPIQVWIWHDDPGTPLSRWRPELMGPLWFAVAGLLIAAAGRGLAIISGRRRDLPVNDHG